MLRHSRLFQAKVPFHTLFQHNHVLEQVFKAPARKEALVFENPGSDPVHYTYGDLQKDVLAMADVIAARRDVLEAEKGNKPLSWMQNPRPADVRSAFTAGEGPLSCDVLPDTGRHNIAMLATPSYTFVISVLTAWSLNQMAVPMSTMDKGDGELPYVLKHSKSTQVLGELPALRDKFRKEYYDLYLRNLDDVSHAPALGKFNTAELDPTVPHTFKVETIYDVPSLLEQLHQRRADGFSNGARPPLHVEHVDAEAARRPIRGAEDVLHRLENERTAATKRELQKEVDKLHGDFKARSTVVDDHDECLSFDDTKLEDLNPVLRLWAKEAASRPTRFDDCLMIHTSGTTARAKGAVHTHHSVSTMVRVLQDAWAWTSEDRIIGMLPLHHIHGLVNVLFCSLASHASCILTPFDRPIRIARRIERGDITLVMAVPTIYTMLVASIITEMSPIEKTGFKKTASQRVRLMVSGSASLPVPTLHQFREISGHTLLERYGMTELGMALSQPLQPISQRLPGTVGSPLPGVTAFVHSATSEDENATGERGAGSRYAEVGKLAIASDALFDRYWGNPEATKKEVVVSTNGKIFFETGDTVGLLPKKNPSDEQVFAIMGRSSEDIIKSRGYKLSALEIEAGLLAQKQLFYEVAVVGIPDETLGEAVVAVIAPQPDAIKQWGIPEDFTQYESVELNKGLSVIAHQLLAHHKCPVRYIITPAIRRNPTGKVNKKMLKEALGLV